MTDQIFSNALYFPAIQRLNGGVASGFQHVEINNDDNKRILQLKGTARNVEACEKEFNWASLTSDDCYIIEIGPTIYAWKGSKANPFEVSQE